MGGIIDGFRGNNQQIARQHGSASVALTTSEDTASPIDCRGAVRGSVYIPTGSSITSLTYYAAPSPGGTHLPLNLADASAAVTQTVEGGNAYDLPAACAGVGSLKIVADAAGTIEISLKG